ncbi:DNA cytosine methyltransferase [Actinotignum sp. UMB0459]|uniref:DNA cytosine methyltransferase n=1 Tax=Actinotignum sp. UMB0459 TaxID=3449314 RepID=UPI003F75E826
MRKIIDLFSGVGGLSLGFSQAGYEVALANEYDHSIAQSYTFNNRTTRMLIEDITHLDFSDTFGPLKDSVFAVIGGPPCQGFSQKGARKTINDERNYLFRYFVKVVTLVAPQYFVMENVPNLLTAEGGVFQEELRELFDKLGYSVSAQVVNAADFGVPQNRRRAIIIGKLSGAAPKLTPNSSDNPTVWDAIGDLNFLASGQGSEVSDYRFKAVSNYQKQLRIGSRKLHNHVATSHSKLTLERLSMIPPNCTQKVLPEEHQTKSIYSGTWTRLDARGLAPTVTTRFDTPSSGQFTHPYLDRAITVREAARLQGFPDTFVFVGKKASQMRQVGNAVPVPLANAIATTLTDDGGCGLFIGHYCLKPLDAVP